jgi:hypothetical protein
MQTSVSIWAKQAIKLRKEAPELVPYVERGEITIAACFRILRRCQQTEQPEKELTFEEEIERSFKRWLSKWPKEDRKEVRDIVDMMPLAKFVDLMPESFAVEFGLETSQGKNS